MHSLVGSWAEPPASSLGSRAKPPASSGLGVDLSTELGRKVFSLLTGAHVPDVHGWTPDLHCQRVLFVRSVEAFVHARNPGAELVCVQPLFARTPEGVLRQTATSRGPASESARATWLAHGPLMSELVPRLGLALKTGHFISSAPDQSLAYVSEDDLALVAATSLASDAILAGFHVIAGPQNLSHRSIVSLAGQVFGKPITLDVVSPSRLEQALCALGMDPFQASAARETDSALLLGDALPSSEAFSRITGLSPLSLRKYLEEKRNVLTEASGSAREASVEARPRACEQDHDARSATFFRVSA
jgi:hypothetical protein